MVITLDKTRTLKSASKEDIDIVFLELGGGEFGSTDFIPRHIDSLPPIDFRSKSIKARAATFRPKEFGKAEELGKSVKKDGYTLRSGRPLEEDSLYYSNQLDSEEIYLESAVSETVDEDFEKDIEDVVKERWGYLVMQFGGVFLTEIRPNRCFIGNKTLADELVIYDEKQKKYGLNFQLLENYLKKNHKGYVQIHFSDIMFNPHPKIKDFDIFSITSGNIKKAQIFIDLAKFLSLYNKGKRAVIPVHLPYFEKWKTSKEVLSFGELSENGKRKSVIKANEVLDYFAEKWPAPEIKLALETGNGESKKDGYINYALVYGLHHLQFLTRGRGGLVGICEDVGHLNLINADWTQYLSEEISEFHVSGNNGKVDEHIIATPSTLKNYAEIMSFLKFFSGNVCAEIGKGRLSADEFLKGIKNLAYTLFSEPEKKDFENLRKIEEHIKITPGKKIADGNLNPERYEKYLEYISK